MSDFDMKDSGDRIVFGENKAVREPATGKGRYDLISPFAIKRLALVLEKGAVKYDDRNWEKGGIPFSRYLQSLERHITQFKMGMEDEDHLGQAMYNLMALLHFDELGDFTDDNLPRYLRKKEEENTENIKNIDRTIDRTIVNNCFEEELKQALATETEETEDIYPLLKEEKVEEKIEEKIEKIEKVEKTKKVKEVIKTEDEEDEW